MDDSERCADGLLTLTENYDSDLVNGIVTFDLFERLQHETGFDWEAIGCAILAACMTTRPIDTNEAANVARSVAKAVGCQAVADDIDSNNGTYEIAVTLERAAQTRLLRDIFGNPFHPVAVDPAWLAWNDGAIPKMAQAIYGERAFDRLPLLADALEDAGCTEADILAHCRGPGPHVRGCWVVDLLLGKE